MYCRYMYSLESHWRDISNGKPRHDSLRNIEIWNFRMVYKRNNERPLGGKGLMGPVGSKALGASAQSLPFPTGLSIMITCPCSEHPLTPHFYIVKLGFTGVYIIFLFLLLNIDCGSNVYPQSMFWAKIRKTSQFFIWKLWFLQPWNLSMKYCCILHGRVFVMSVSCEAFDCFQVPRLIRGVTFCWDDEYEHDEILKFVSNLQLYTPYQICRSNRRYPLFGMTKVWQQKPTN